MTASAALTLARAMADARAAASGEHRLETMLSPAQAGAALRLARQGAIELDGSALESVRAVSFVVDEAFGSGPAMALLKDAVIPATTLGDLVEGWFDGASSPQASACAGYWLANLFLRGVGEAQSVELTRFLIGGSRLEMQAPGRISVRRYPTGGISEKQALILPAILRSLAVRMPWVSPFLVAPQLAHTGGTADKLAVLPGFSTLSAGMLQTWDPIAAPVCYLSAGPDLCPRDAAMYRLRGETGTVADRGLIAASIMSKQIAAPADIIILDILHGRTAFLTDRESATTFGSLCVAIGDAHGLRVTPVLRPADTLLGRSVGASTEVLEAVLILSGTATYETAIAERERAVEFAARAASAAGLSPDTARKLAHSAFESGTAFDELLALWRDHGVSEDFLSKVRTDPRRALLGEVEQAQVLASKAGLLSVDPIALADVINTRLSAAGSAEERAAANVGGLELHLDIGSQCDYAQTIATIFGQSCKEVASAVTSLVQIVEV